jgi:hypothetical protein
MENCIRVSSTIKTDYHDITEILLKVVLNTINQTKNSIIGDNSFKYQQKCEETKAY